MCSDRARPLLVAALATLAAACAPSGGTRELPAVIDAIEPSCAGTASPTSIVVRGTFPVAPRVSVSGGGAELDTTYRGWIGDVPLRDVVWQDPGTISATVPASMRAGLYALTLESPFHRRVLRPGFEIRAGGCGGARRAALGVEATVAPNAVTVGQQVTLSALVRNTGAEPLLDVDAAVSTTPVEVTLVSRQAGPRTLATGESGTFTWTYSASAATADAGVTFVVSAAARDAGGAGVAAPGARTNPFVVSRPASVTAHTHAPSSVNVGRTFTYVLDASNTGSAPALVAAAVTVTVTGSATVTTLTSPVPARIAGGSGQSLAWTFTASAPCDVALSVGITATDLNTSRSLTVASVPPSTVKVLRAAALATVVDVAPAVPAGGTTTVVATVTNSGGAVAEGVSAAIRAAPALFTRVAAPSAPRTIPGGASTAFAWTYRAEAGATGGTFAVDAAGVDANDLTTVAAARAVSGRVAAAYPIGGSVSGLGSAPVVLRNGAEELTVDRDGPFELTTPVASGAPYEVTVATQPADRTCEVADGAGEVAAAPVTAVSVTCSPYLRTLATLVDPPGAGTVTCDGGVCQATYVDGAGPIVIRAIPAAGQAFASWSGDCAGSEACSVTMTADRAVTAHFSGLTCTLTTTIDPEGAGTVSCGGGPCLATYPYSAGDLEITATPASDAWTFAGWTSDAPTCGGTGPCLVQMTEDRHVTASFQAVPSPGGPSP